jgi:hypothetical protein
MFCHYKTTFVGTFYGFRLTAHVLDIYKIEPLIYWFLSLALLMHLQLWITSHYVKYLLREWIVVWIFNLCASWKLDIQLHNTRVCWTAWGTGKKWGLPRIEKNIINPAEICTTRRLPTRVKPSNPAFSLFQISVKLYSVFRTHYTIIHKHYNKNRMESTYTDTEDPLAVPNKPPSKIPTPYRQAQKQMKVRCLHYHFNIQTD